MARFCGVAVQSAGAVLGGFLLALADYVFWECFARVRFGGERDDFERIWIH